MEGSQFFRSLSHSSSEESSEGDFSLRSEPDPVVAAGSQNVVSDTDDVDTPGDDTLVDPTANTVSNSDNMVNPGDMSPPVDPTASGYFREMNYCCEGYQHHQRARQYAADNQFSAAVREWKLARHYNYYPSYFCLGNCYKQAKGVTKNLLKVFRHQNYITLFRVRVDMI